MTLPLRLFSRGEAFLGAECPPSQGGAYARTAWGRIQPVSEVSRGEQHPPCRTTPCPKFHKEKGRRCHRRFEVTMYIYIATTCRENSILTKHYAQSPTSYVCLGYESRRGLIEYKSIVLNRGANRTPTWHEQIDYELITIQRYSMKMKTEVPVKRA
jgi:hypothetical protein